MRTVHNDEVTILRVLRKPGALFSYFHFLAVEVAG